MRLSAGMSLNDLLRWVGAGGGGPVLSTLLDGLVSYWPLNEQSGVRSDVVGTNHLTDNNTVMAVNRGPVGTVASFVAASSEWLEGTPTWNGGIDTGFSVAAWVDGNADGQSFMGNGLHYGARIYVGSQNGLGGRFAVRQSGGGDPSLSGDFPIGLSRYHFVVWGVDGVTNKLFLSIDGSAKLLSSGTNTGQDLSAGKLWLGRDSSNIPEYYSGNMGWVGAWSSALDDAEIASLFNSGNGKQYADLTTAEKVGLVSYWNLDEVSGQRNDSHGTNHLTDNNTVGSVCSGPQSTVAKFVAASSESLGNAAATSVGGAGGLYTAMWARIATDGGGYQFFSSIADSWSTSVASAVYINGSAFYHRIGDGVGYSDCLSAVTPTTGLWHFIEAWVGADKKPYLSIDTISAPAPGSALAGTPFSSANWLLGALQGIGTYHDGNMANVGVWSQIPSAGVRASLFNSGVGKRYADLTAAEKVGLVSYYNLDENSGTRNDSHGTNHLTDNNTVMSVINSGGAMEKAAGSFVAANNENLKSTDLADVALLPFTVAFWVKPTALAAYGCLCGKSNFSNTGFWFDFATSGQADFHVANTYALGPSTMSIGQWYHIVAWSEGDGAKIHQQINNGTISDSSGNVTVAATAGAFAIANNQGANLPVDVIVDEFAIWSRVLTSDERTELFNAGRGKYYDFS